MTKVSANFEFLDKEHDDIVIPCTPEQTMGEVIDLFKEQVKSKIEFNDYLFYNRTEEINQELKVSDSKPNL